jgi:hypothetical protein
MRPDDAIQLDQSQQFVVLQRPSTIRSPLDQL